MTRRTLAAAFVALLAVTGLAACAPAAEPDPTPTATVEEGDPTPTADSSATETPDAGAADPTCETIIPRTTAADFRSIGWSPQSEVFRVGATEVSDGILRKWSSGSPTADRVQMFGWAPIDAAEAEKAQDDLVGSGWKREDGTGDEVYVTENPDWLAGRGVDGYGITYLFGDGWVKVADTKQSLVLIDWPPAQR
ncbi:hypothetical protein D8Y23_05875 [Microbacterium enclense]|uniref:Uncharacterized protein n=1 Tax=Microbacterium enclense TaxID=993073 RepID=A0A3S3P5Y1_9MICO|nr:hypothetical protein [Microbacterium enclense]RWR20351.1 hypothetical protein D8Y23_05875 [Microbacterium enclense]